MKNKSIMGMRIASAALSGLGLAVYIYTATTGYLAGRGVDVIIVALLLVAALVALALAFGADRAKPLLVDVGIYTAVVTLLAALGRFILERVSLAADVYFIPVNYPAAEEMALNLSAVGVGLLIMALVVHVVDAFRGGKAS